MLRDSEHTQPSPPAEASQYCPTTTASVRTGESFLKGKLTYRYVDSTQETIGEGEAYYARPGHLPSSTRGLRLLNSVPPTNLQQTMEVISKNMELTS